MSQAPASNGQADRFFLYCRFWPGFTEQSPCARFNGLPDDAIATELGELCSLRIEKEDRWLLGTEEVDRRQRLARDARQAELERIAKQSKRRRPVGDSAVLASLDERRRKWAAHLAGDDVGDEWRLNERRRADELRQQADGRQRLLQKLVRLKWHHGRDSFAEDQASLQVNEWGPSLWSRKVWIMDIRGQEQAEYLVAQCHANREQGLCDYNARFGYTPVSQFEHPFDIVDIKAQMRNLLTAEPLSELETALRRLIVETLDVHVATWAEEIADHHSLNTPLEPSEAQVMPTPDQRTAAVSALDELMQVCDRVSSLLTANHNPTQWIGLPESHLALRTATEYLAALGWTPDARALDADARKAFATADHHMLASACKGYDQEYCADLMGHYGLPLPPADADAAERELRVIEAEARLHLARTRNHAVRVRDSIASTMPATNRAVQPTKTPQAPPSEVLIETPAADAADKEPPPVHPDGPGGHHQWWLNNILIIDEMQDAAWEMVNHLWTVPDRTSTFGKLRIAVYGSADHGATDNAFGSLRRQANKYFKKHGIPWAASIDKGKVKLLPGEPPSPQQESGRHSGRKSP